VSRIVTLMLVDGGGVPLGTLPPFETGLPYWQERTDVVRRDVPGSDQMRWTEGLEPVAPRRAAAVAEP
jgi:hypothetical protein